MKIMTIGASPYILARNGRINGDVIKHLKSEGHTVLSAVWHHDEGYFLPDDQGVHNYEVDGEVICKLVPFTPHPEQSTPQIYEIMKQFQPEMLITIGDYKETDFVYAIKAMYPNLFKWVAVLTVDCLWINQNHKEALEYADYVLSTSEFGFVDLSNLCNVKGEFLPYGPNHDIFYPREGLRSEKMRVLSIAKNAQSSNVGAFIKAAGELGSILSLEESAVEAVLHTNLYDPGDYDLNLLMDRYNASNIKLPETFVSLKDGPSDEEMAALYSKAHIFVDCSIKSATGLGMLEAMACGCIPVGMDVGRVGEIISMLPKEFQFFIPYETYIGASEEEYSIISVTGLVETLLEIKQDIFESSKNLAEASEAAIDVARKLSNRNFLQRLTDVISQVSMTKGQIVVETF